jgi:hypothetical protein
MTVDVIILNRNLKAVTEQLVTHLAKLDGIGGVYVADSGSTDTEVSSHTIARDDSEFARVNGLRINRGFNLGLLEWLKLQKQQLANVFAKCMFKELVMNILLGFNKL